MNRPRRSLRRDSWAVGIRFALILGGPLCPSLAAAADQVLLLLSSDRKPYRAAEEELQARFADVGLVAEGRLLEGVSPGELEGYRACVAIGTEAARWTAEHRSAELTAVYCMVSDPDGHKIPPTLPGVTTDVPLSKQFQLVDRVVPGVTRLGMFFNSDSHSSQTRVDRVRAAVPLGWEVVAVNTRDHDNFADAQDALIAQRIDVIWTAADRNVFDQAAVRSLLLAGVRKRIPVFGFSIPFVRAGALIGVGVDPRAQGRQAAALTARLLVDPNTAAPDSADFDIAVNLVVADKLAVTIPGDVLNRAPHVFPEGVRP